MSETEFDPSAQTLPAYSDPCEVSRLRSLLDDLMKAVEPFANEYDDVADTCFEDDANAGVDCTVGDLRRAREAYLKAKGE